MTHDRVPTLLAWCSENKVWIDPRIEIVDRSNKDTGGAIAVFSKDTPIDSLVTLVTIPKSAVISVRSCALAGLIPAAPYGHGAHLALSLALYSELLKGANSQWFGYLQSLPQEPVGIALLWGSDQLLQLERGEELVGDQEEIKTKDRKLAQIWATGTEIDKEQRGEDGIQLLEEVQEYYYMIVKPLLSRLSQPCSITGFVHAYSLVSSRAFLVDAYHGLAMVPIADAFNHIQYNHIHLESDYDVCVECGSLNQCPHDDEENSGLDKTITNERDAGTEDTCDMVTNLPIEPRSEIFNTYGERLTNAQLLVRYGFTLESNDNDLLSWKMTELSTPRNVQRAEFIQFYEHIIQTWPRYSRWSVSNLVYQPETSFGEEDEHWQTPQQSTSTSRLRKPVLCINSDAKLSHHLWIYCTLVAIIRVVGIMPTEENNILRLLGRMAERQLNLEGDAGGGGEGGHNVLHRQQDGADQRFGAWNATDGKDGKESEEATEQILVELVRTVVALCRERAMGLGPKGQMSAEEMGDAVDRLESDMVNTRLAMMEVLSERSILESCEWAWEEFGTACGGKGDD